MNELIRALPQGLLWYPATLAMLAILVALLVSSSGRRGARAQRRRERPSILASMSSLVSRATRHDYAMLELERHVIGLLLQANGYRGYTVEQCRHYAGHGAPSDLAALLREHLENAPQSERDGNTVLPPRCEALVRHLERQTEEQR